MTGKIVKNRYGEEIELEFELTDIMEEIKFNNDGTATNDEKVIEENIIEILKREKLWKKNYTLVFPSGISNFFIPSSIVSSSTQFLDIGSTEDDSSSYQYDFEIFSDPNTVVASGTCYGSLIVYYLNSKRKHSEGFKDEIDTVEVLDMTLEICECKKTFHDGEEKEKVCFT